MKGGPAVVRVPGDKSISHRALILAALASGTSRVGGILQSADVQATARCLREMGWTIPSLATSIEIAGRGLAAPGREGVARLDCGNSGTTSRLLMGVAAAQPFTSEFDGDASLRVRPMARVTKPLSDMGAIVDYLDPDGEGSVDSNPRPSSRSEREPEPGVVLPHNSTTGSPRPRREGLPLRITGGPLRPIRHETAVASAQVKGALLLAGVCGGAQVALHEPMTSRDHTERMLRALGASIEEQDGWLVLRPTERLAPFDLQVPGDPSSAAFFVARQLLRSGGELVLPDVLLNPTRTGFLGVIERMGGGGLVRAERVRESAGERVGDLVVSPARSLRGVTVLPPEIPALIDEIPVLAVLAARAEGETRVTGASELRVKESDRISALVTNLQRLGVDAEEVADGLVVRGGRAPLAGRVETAGDHRIAMAFGVLGASPDAEVIIDNPGCVEVSFPDFWRELDRVGE